MKEASIKDSVSMKALILLNEGRVDFPDNIPPYASEVEVFVYGEHSDKSVFHKDEFIPYIVTLRKDGTFSCSCDFMVYAKEDYKQFWGDIAIRSAPECSHAMAAKLHPDYIKWISDGKRKPFRPPILSKYPSGNLKLKPGYKTRGVFTRRRRNVDLSDLARR